MVRKKYLFFRENRKFLFCFCKKDKQKRARQSSPSLAHAQYSIVPDVNFRLQKNTPRIMKFCKIIVIIDVI